VVQILTILAVLMGRCFQKVSFYAPLFVWLTSVCTIASGFQYLYIGMEMFNETS